DKRIRWSEIAQYKFELESRGKWFKATLRNGKIWSFCQRTDTLKTDDFLTFREAFNQGVDLYNRQQAQTSSQIALAKTFYQTRTAYILARVLLATLFAFP